MVKSLFVHFKVLYEAILDRNPTLAAEHALRQEEEVYKKVHKLTYRHVRLIYITEQVSGIEPFLATRRPSSPA